MKRILKVTMLLVLMAWSVAIFTYTPIFIAGNPFKSVPLNVERGGNLIDSSKIYSCSKQRDLSNIEYIVIHHTGVCYAGAPCNVAEYHSNNNGWTCGVGYHYYVMRDGSIVKLHRDSDLTAHAVGYNTKGIAVCFDGLKPTEKQLEAMARITEDIMLKYNIKPLNIIGHGSVNATECPGFDVNELKVRLCRR